MCLLRLSGRFSETNVMEYAKRILRTNETEFFKHRGAEFNKVYSVIAVAAVLHLTFARTLLLLGFGVNDAEKLNMIKTDYLHWSFNPLPSLQPQPTDI